mmetsp:Transcript_17164/g.27290  ORF Transcript_17164/g.27290 Transcript_17164/m.27290 type:complete len:256 (+) Transcript_17164:845-1612(+)
MFWPFLRALSAFLFDLKKRSIPSMSSSRSFSFSSLIAAAFASACSYRSFLTFCSTAQFLLTFCFPMLLILTFFFFFFAAFSLSISPTSGSESLSNSESQSSSSFSAFGRADAYLCSCLFCRSTSLLKVSPCFFGASITTPTVLGSIMMVLGSSLSNNILMGRSVRCFVVSRGLGRVKSMLGSPTPGMMMLSNPFPKPMPTTSSHGQKEIFLTLRPGVLWTMYGFCTFLCARSPLKNCTLDGNATPTVASCEILMS